AHVCETGGARRTWLHGLAKTHKRYLATVMAHNLGLVLRKLFGIGKPREFAARWAAAFSRWSIVRTLLATLGSVVTSQPLHPRPAEPDLTIPRRRHLTSTHMTFAPA